MTARRFSMLRVGPGDYLLPSNDFSPARGRVWRLTRYDEDGSAVSGSYPNEVPIVGSFWWLRYATTADLVLTGILHDGGSLALDAIDDVPDHLAFRLRDRPLWVDFAHMHRTRKDALDYAMQSDEREAAKAAR